MSNYVPSYLANHLPSASFVKDKPGGVAVAGRGLLWPGGGGRKCECGRADAGEGVRCGWSDSFCSRIP